MSKKNINGIIAIALLVVGFVFLITQDTWFNGSAVALVMAILCFIGFAYFIFVVINRKG